jgi:nucleotide-binding universal stress UspA family protein
MSGRNRIVVGVDGSPSSQAALQWAAGQAARTGAGVEALIAWEYPALAAGFGYVPSAVLTTSQYTELAEKIVADAISNVTGPGSGVPFTSRVGEGNAAQILLDAAAGAELLVVGSRGHGTFAGAVLGSVSQRCAQHAPCPVVVVRGSGSGA